jgi:hypothetical protein
LRQSASCSIADIADLDRRSRSPSPPIIPSSHGGRIEVQTELSEFAEFIITLPRDNGTVVDQKPE